MLLTTSRRPTKNMRTLCRDISSIFPNIVRINRGKLSLERMAEKALESGAEKVIVIDRGEKGLGKIEFFNLRQDGLESFPPIIYLHSAKFRRDFEEQMPKKRGMASIAIVASSKRTFEVEKLEKALSSFFDVPILSVEEAVNGKYNVAMQILARSSNSVNITFRLIPKLIEIGPQIGISHLVWKRAK